MIPFRRKQRMIDNFQRYFLVFSIFIFSYLLLINWNPPAQEEIISENILNDSEYLPTDPIPEPDSFVDESSSFAESSNVTSLICGAEETVEVSNENQKLEISLSSGQIIKSELLNYPLEINGQANTLLFNKCGDSVGQSEEIQGLSDRLQQLESRTEKQQQDLTALLKLVRQLANKQAELEKEQFQPRRQSSLFAPLIFLLLLMLVASAGWLYWLNPDLVITLSTKLLNNGFDFMLNLIAQFGLL